MSIARLYDRMGCDVLALDLGNSISSLIQCNPLLTLNSPQLGIP